MCANDRHDNTILQRLIVIPKLLQKLLQISYVPLLKIKGFVLRIKIHVAIGEIKKFKDIDVFKNKLLSIYIYILIRIVFSQSRPLPYENQPINRVLH